jgi:hypothetical protein
MPLGILICQRQLIPVIWRHYADIAGTASGHPRMTAPQTPGHHRPRPGGHRRKPPGRLADARGCTLDSAVHVKPDHATSAARP